MITFYEFDKREVSKVDNQENQKENTDSFYQFPKNKDKNQRETENQKTEEKIPLRTFQIVSGVEDHGSVLLIWLDKSIIPLLAILISVLGVFIIAFGLSFFQSRL